MLTSDVIAEGKVSVVSGVDLINCFKREQIYIRYKKGILGYEGDETLELLA